jgi:mannose-6-phosphate isomerase-like protein (cupin superfamily)
MLVQRLGDNALEWALYGGAGKVDVEWYFRERTALSTSVVRYHLEPGSEEGEHLHLEGDPDSCSVKSSDELYVVVAGEVVMTLDGERSVLRAGDALYAPSGSRHGVANESDRPADVILIFGAPDPASPNLSKE